MSGWSGAGAAVGLLGGLGLVLVVARVPVGRTPDLEARIAPYLPDVLPSRLLENPDRRPVFGAAERLLAPVLADVAAWLERAGGGADGVRRRLDQLASPTTVEQFRVEQVVWGAAGALAGTLLGAWAVAARGASVLPALVLVVLGAALGVLARDHALVRRVRRRQDRIAEELPAVAELLALSVAAGEGAAGALDRVARTCRGELSAELRRALADARSGASLVQALEALAHRADLPSVTRFVDGITVAVDRGTPLAEVLHAQAADAREAARRRLVETGGAKEILMMVPVVFLVLPVTVLFIVDPGLAALDLAL